MKERPEQEVTEVIEVPPAAISKELKKRWSHFIQKVSETDPPYLPQVAGGEIRNILIDQP